MTKKEKIFAVIGLTAFFLLLSNMGRAAYQVLTDTIIPDFEGFRPNPYWDVSRWSWGYGTPAPGSTGTISQADALAEMRKKVNADYAYLKPLISRDLAGNQWAALLSFSYNEGEGNADNLITNINSGNDDALGNQWALYNKVRDEDGNLQYSQTLADRRAQEWAIWQGTV